MDYAYKQIKDFEWMLKKLIKMRDFRKKYKILQTGCFLTNLSKNYTWNEKIKIKIENSSRGTGYFAEMFTKT